MPATMNLRGKANWWEPAPRRRLHDSIGIKEASSPVVNDTSTSTRGSAMDDTVGMREPFLTS